MYWTHKRMVIVTCIVCSTIGIGMRTLYMTKNSSYVPMMLHHKDILAYEIDTRFSKSPPSASITGKRLFKEKPLVIWATEWHMAPIKDLKDTLEPFGVRVLDYNLDPWRCNLHDCELRKKLKVLTSNNVLNIDPPVPSKFFEEYKDDPEMKSVDVFFCGYPASLCEMYHVFNKSVLILASTRYDVGRYTKERWSTLNDKLIDFARHQENVIGGNNLYDAKYIEYYTGIKTRALQSICDYTGANYSPKLSKFLVLRRRDRGFNKLFFDDFKAACTTINCTVSIELLGGYSYKGLAEHRGIVHVPYQVSVMSIFELYRMNIPQFFPSLDLFAEWQHKHYIMPERTFDGAWFGKRPDRSIIESHHTQAGIPDPKNEKDLNAIRYWLQFSDFYQIMPHVFYYNSTAHLVSILQRVTTEELKATSRLMEAHNIQMKKEMLTIWRDILLGYAERSFNNPH